MKLYKEKAIEKYFTIIFTLVSIFGVEAQIRMNIDSIIYTAIEEMTPGLSFEELDELREYLELDSLVLLNNELDSSLSRVMEEASGRRTFFVEWLCKEEAIYLEVRSECDYATDKLFIEFRERRLISTGYFMLNKSRFFVYTRDMSSNKEIEPLFSKSERKVKLYNRASGLIGNDECWLSQQISWLYKCVNGEVSFLKAEKYWTWKLE